MPTSCEWLESRLTTAECTVFSRGTFGNIQTALVARFHIYMQMMKLMEWSIHFTTALLLAQSAFALRHCAVSTDLWKFGCFSCDWAWFSAVTVHCVCTSITQWVQLFEICKVRTLTFLQHVQICHGSELTNLYFSITSNGKVQVSSKVQSTSTSKRWWLNVILIVRISGFTNLFNNGLYTVSRNAVDAY